MKHLHKFLTQQEHDALYNSLDYIEPWIAYVEDEQSVTYNRPSHDYSKDYFTIEALEDGNVYFKYNYSANTDAQRYMEYSKDDGKTWIRTTNVNSKEVIMTIPLLTGEKALVRGDNDRFGVVSSRNSSHFYSDIETNVYGNIMSLCYADNFSDKVTLSDVNNYMFAYLFYSTTNYNTYIVSAKNLILPATTLAQSCYASMFQGCTSLVSAPELPATALANNCYVGMFHSCTSLTTAPELPATTLAEGCYNGMFGGCTNLNYIKAMFTTTPSSTYTSSWVSGVAPTGTFVKNSAATWDITGVNGVPTGWTVQTASV